MLVGADIALRKERDSLGKFNSLVKYTEPTLILIYPTAPITNKKLYSAVKFLFFNRSGIMVITYLG